MRQTSLDPWPLVIPCHIWRHLTTCFLFVVVSRSWRDETADGATPDEALSLGRSHATSALPDHSNSKEVTERGNHKTNSLITCIGHVTCDRRIWCVIHHVFSSRTRRSWRSSTQRTWRRNFKFVIPFIHFWNWLSRFMYFMYFTLIYSAVERIEKNFGENRAIVLGIHDFTIFLNRVLPNPLFLVHRLSAAVWRLLQKTKPSMERRWWSLVNLHVEWESSYCVYQYNIM